MSFWGPRPYENDDAADWLSELENDPCLELVQEALLEVVDAADVGYVEIPECCIAVAAAEVLANLIDMSGNGQLLEEETAEKLKKELDRLSIRNQIKLVAQAVAAVNLVLNDEENSELRQVLEEDKPLMDTWIDQMKYLEDRLKFIFHGLSSNP